MNVLALDTATEHGSVALARDGALVECRPLPPGWTNTSLHGEIARLLSDHQLATRDLNGYAVTNGPGSFTGVRVGLTAVKGLAEIHGAPVATVSTLLAIAAAARETSGVSRAETFVALLDARRGQVFGGAYREEDGVWKEIVEESVSSLAVFLDRLRGDPAAQSPASDRIVYCGVDLESYTAVIEQAGLREARMSQVSPCLAASLAKIGSRMIWDGRGAGAAAADANYVRISDAELFWKA